MRFPESWLRTFVNPELDSQALSHALTMSGLEVESLSAVAPMTEKVVVGKVLSTQAHPNADKLKVCQVDVGQAQPLSIVCGAPNVTVGIKVPVALVGAILPPSRVDDAPFEIKLSTLRGVESQGMLCSARELKLSEDHQGLLILSEQAVVGQNIRETLHLDDQVFEIKLTPNRADCLSILGVAREVAAITDAVLKPLQIESVAVDIEDVRKVNVLEPELCGRFSHRIVKGVNARAQTPDWMVERLERAGQRSVSALVDITNYVMLELGQPSHVFDLAKLTGDLSVRWAKAGESLTLLNGKTIELQPHIGVIADALGVQSLAGIMGGQASSVTLETQDIFLEVAFWWADAIRGRARGFHLSSEAAHRFERGVDPEQTVVALERLTNLILEICGGKVGAIEDQKINVPDKKQVLLRLNRASKIIGATLTEDIVANIFNHLNFEFSVENQIFKVTPPSYRFDIEIEEDLIEEIARIYGFEQIPAQLPIAMQKMQSESESHRSLHDLRHQMVARGYTETLNFSFVDQAWETDLAINDDPIQLINPIAQQYAVMRTSLLGSLLHVLNYNLNRKIEHVKIFEIGKVFFKDKTIDNTFFSVVGVNQPLRLGGLAYGFAMEEQWGVPARRVDFFDVKGDIEVLFAPGHLRFVATQHPALHPGRSAEIEWNEKVIGWVGELHPKWLQKYQLVHAPILFEVDAQALMFRNLPQVQTISKFPAVKRDIAVVVDQDVSVQSLLDAMNQALEISACHYVQHIALFDEYLLKSKFSKRKERSLAFRIVLQDISGTLLDENVDQVIQILFKAMSNACDARLRSESF